MEHSIDRAGRRRDRKFKPLVLGQIQAAGDITEGLTLIQASTYIAARGIDNGAPFAEGHVLSPGLTASVLPTQIGRMLYGAEAVQLIRQFEGQRGSEE